MVDPPARFLAIKVLLLVWHLPSSHLSAFSFQRISRFSNSRIAITTTGWSINKNDRAELVVEQSEPVSKSKSKVSPYSEINSGGSDGDDNNNKNLPFFSSWPNWLQNGLRDLGGVRFIVNAATRSIAAPIFYWNNPWCFPEFLRISGPEYPWLVSALRFVGTIDKDKPDIDFTKQVYGDHPSQVAQVMIVNNVDESHGTAPLFLFFMVGSGVAVFQRCTDFKPTIP